MQLAVIFVFLLLFSGQLKKNKMLVFNVSIFVVLFSLVNADCFDEISKSKGTKEFLDNIFKNYEGQTNEMALENFKKLLTKLEIGSIVVKCSKDDIQCLNNIHLAGRRRRSLPDAYNNSSHKSHWRYHNTKVWIIFLCIFFYFALRIQTF